MGTPALWAGFSLAVLTLLALDLWVFHPRARRPSMSHAAGWSVFYVALSLGFNLWILRTHGSAPALTFFTGYVLEKSLSLDNLLVFLLVFRAFGVEEQFQHRVLFWGVLGALVLRGLLVGMGAVLVNRFAWILYVFGAFLIIVGTRTLIRGHPKFDPQRNRALRWAGRLFPVAEGDTGESFFVSQNGRRVVTRLFVALLVIEAADLLFAVDSIPAVFGITHDPFLVYTSNVCAILGLRAFYTLLAGALPLFRYLDVGIGAVLIFIGGKMLADTWIHLPTYVSLAIVGTLLGLAVIVSIIADEFRDRPQRLLMPETKENISAWIARLAVADPSNREQAARELFRQGCASAEPILAKWFADQEFRTLARPGNTLLTVGVAVDPARFHAIHAAAGRPRMADVPQDQDAMEFTLAFAHGVRLDILTPRDAAGEGALARYLARFGEGIQQIECDVRDVTKATQLLRNRFALEPVYPDTRTGADGTRVNFFLVPASEDRKILIELVEVSATKKK